MSLEQELAQLDRDAKAAKVRLDLGNALDRLRSNRDFNKLITEGYLKDEAVRLVQLKADPNSQKPETQAAILRDIDAIGSLAQYFNTITVFANMAKRDLESYDATREALASEGL